MGLSLGSVWDVQMVGRDVVENNTETGIENGKNNPSCRNRRHKILWVQNFPPFHRRQTPAAGPTQKNQ
jgi:hypothetical protein